MSFKSAVNQGLGVLGSAGMSAIGFLQEVNWLGVASGVLSLVLTSIIIMKTYQEYKLAKTEAEEAQFNLDQKKQDASGN